MNTVVTKDIRLSGVFFPMDEHRPRIQQYKLPKAVLRTHSDSVFLAGSRQRNLTTTEGKSKHFSGRGKMTLQGDNPRAKVTERLGVSSMVVVKFQLPSTACAVRVPDFPRMLPGGGRSAQGPAQQADGTAHAGRGRSAARCGWKGQRFCH